jgi:hypothetical protein
MTADWSAAYIGQQHSCGKHRRIEERMSEEGEEAGERRWTVRNSEEKNEEEVIVKEKRKEKCERG